MVERTPEQAGPIPLSGEDFFDSPHQELKQLDTMAQFVLTALSSERNTNRDKEHILQKPEENRHSWDEHMLTLEPFRSAWLYLDPISRGALVDRGVISPTFTIHELIGGELAGNINIKDFNTGVWILAKSSGDEDNPLPEEAEERELIIEKEYQVDSLDLAKWERNAAGELDRVYPRLAEVIVKYSIPLQIPANTAPQIKRSITLKKIEKLGYETTTVELENSQESELFLEQIRTLLEVIGPNVHPTLEVVFRSQDQKHSK